MWQRPIFGEGIYKEWQIRPPLLFQTTRGRDTNKAKLGPEQGTKQRIPPTFIKNWGIPQTFFVPTYKYTPFGVWCWWIKRLKIKKNLFSWSLHLNSTRNSSAWVTLYKPVICLTDNLVIVQGVVGARDDLGYRWNMAMWRLRWPWLLATSPHSLHCFWVSL